MSGRPRRSARSRGSDEVIAPGYGTKEDIRRLTNDLGGGLNEKAVLAMMRSEGRGIQSESAAGTTETPSKGGSGLPFSSPGTSSAWADFIQEEGVSNVLNFEPTSKKQKTDDVNPSSTFAAVATSKPSSSGQVDYDLSVLTKVEKTLPFGSLVQAGTLDTTFIGRKNLKSSDNALYHLNVPTVLLPKIAITRVATSCNAAHAIAIDRSNQAYGWGRNEGLVLGSAFGENAAVIPTPRIIATDIETAALGKSHTIFLKTDGTLHGLGQNKSGQCGWRESVKQSGVLKPCIALVGKKEDDDSEPAFVRIACGEDFSVAVDNHGVMYTTGSSEFGQLANGETGEHFVSANKLAFANGYGFSPQTVFHENDDSDGSRNDQFRKTKPIPFEIKIQDVAAGKHHALALEAPSSEGAAPRIFSWGCGNYGVLGHNRQKDEYYPRHVASLSRGMIFTKLAAGSNSSLALTTQGHVYYWGQLRSASEAVMKPQLVDALANNQHHVTRIGAGGASVVCTTDLGNTVVWGGGPYGELGLGSKKSSAKPAFVDSLSGLVVSDLACGQGSILYVIKDDKSLPTVDLEAVEASLK